MFIYFKCSVCFPFLFLTNACVSSSNWLLSIADILLPITLMTSGWAISLDDSAGQYERIGIHCVHFNELFMVCLKLRLVWRGMTAAGWEENTRMLKGILNFLPLILMLGSLGKYWSNVTALGYLNYCSD